MRVYLDNSATTVLASEVVEAMLPYFTEDYGNAQSVHSFGRKAKSAVENARRQVATLIGASAAEITFLSGGTEADNLAILGIATAYKQYGRHIITTRIEHPAVLASCEALERDGFRVTYLPVDDDGAVSVDAVREAVADDTILVSVMHANNETGVIQPIEEIAQIVAEARAQRASNIHFHTDAVQSAGKTTVDVNYLGVDLLSISAHKIHGPKGVGALYVRKGVRLAKLLFGGHHERDRRPGTENVPGIAGLGRAAEFSYTRLEENAERMSELRDYLEGEMISRLPGVTVNGNKRRVPNIANLRFEGIDGESLLIALDLRGIAVSTGSACSSGSLDPSHVLLAMGLGREEVRASLRFSLSYYTTREEIDYTIAVVEETVTRLRHLAQNVNSEPATFL